MTERKSRNKSQEIIDNGDASFAQKIIDKNKEIREERLRILKQAKKGAKSEDSRKDIEEKDEGNDK